MTPYLAIVPMVCVWFGGILAMVAEAFRNPGERLPMDRLLAGVDAVVGALGPDGGAAAAEAIMTTDTVPKTAQVDRPGWSVGGMAKGAGMLAPALATMLVVVTTDGHEVLSRYPYDPFGEGGVARW